MARPHFPAMRRPALLAVAGGMAGGLLLALLALKLSPGLAVMGILGLLLAMAVLVNPALGFLVTAAVIPIERLGRFTSDSSMYTVSLMRVFGMLTLGSYLLHVLLRRLPLRFGVAFFLYLGYWGLGLLGAFHTTDFLGTVRACSAILGNLLFFFLVINIVRDLRLARLAVTAWLTVSVLIGAYTIYDWHIGSRVMSEGGIGQTESRFSTAWSDSSEWQELDHTARAMGSTSHAAVYGINLILTLPFFCLALRRPWRPWARAGLWLALGIIGYNILLTNTRAVILLSVLVIGFCIARRLLVLRASTFLGALTLALVTIPFIPSEGMDRILSLRNYTPQHSETLRIRLQYWKAGLQVAQDNWLFGIGVGNQNEVPKYINGPGPEQTTVHCEYLQTLMEVGLPGWLLFFGFQALLLHHAFRTGALLRRTPGGEDAYWLIVAVQIAMAATLIYGFQVDVFHFPLKGWWLIAGLTLVLHRQASAPERLNQGKGQIAS